MKALSLNWANTLSSAALCRGKPTAARTGLGGNRFQGGWLEGVPIPLPRDYLRGIDLQKTDFERGLPSYLMGEWRDRGWWYFYAVCAAIKVPLGTWLLGLVALGVRIHGLAAVTFRRRLSDNNTRSASPAPNWIGWRDELVLLLPAVILVAFVSSQTGFSHHFRYVLPAFPFLFIWVSSVAERAACGPKVLRGIVIGAARLVGHKQPLGLSPQHVLFQRSHRRSPRRSSLRSGIKHRLGSGYCVSAALVKRPSECRTASYALSQLLFP